MKVININSAYLLTSAQLSFTESVILCGEEETCKDYDSISVLMNEIPIFLLDEKSMPSWENMDNESENKPTEYLGFYTETKLGYGTRIPAIYLCPERILKEVVSEEHLLFLIAKVIIHEFAHAKMSSDPNPNAPLNETFFKWMEEPLANLITLYYFEKFQECQRRISQQNGYGKLYLTKHITTTPFEFVKDFIRKQPKNYQLGLALYNSSITDWKIWRRCKRYLAFTTKKVYEKECWLEYTQKNGLKCDPLILSTLFNALFKGIILHK